MNILHTIDVYESGGAETVFIQLISQIDRNNYNPIVLIPRRGWLYDQLANINIEPLTVDMSGSFNLNYLKTLVKIIKQNDIQIIHSHLFGSNFYCSLAGFITGRPVISTFHGVIDIAPDERFLGIKSFLLRLGSSKVVFVSDFLKNTLQSRLHVKDKTCQVIYNGVDIQQLGSDKNKDFRQEFGIDKDEVFVALVGNINHSKGYDILISAAKLLSNKPFRFVIAGDTSDDCFQSLSQQISDSNLQNKVIFAGFVSNVKDFIKSADIYLLTSRDEGFSISTIEAMASSVPVVVTRCGGPEEIIDPGIDGLMVDNESPQQIADALLGLVEDETTSNRLVGAALKKVRQRFSIESIIQQYLDLYQLLLRK